MLHLSYALENASMGVVGEAGTGVESSAVSTATAMVWPRRGMAVVGRGLRAVALDVVPDLMLRTVCGRLASQRASFCARPSHFLFSCAVLEAAPKSKS